VLVLVSFVLVLAAAVTLVVGLLQSGLTLIYLSIGCSVLAGIVLAVAVLRGRPEPKAAAPVGRPFTPPASAPPYPASAGAPSAAAATTTTYPSAATPPPPPPPPPPSPAPVPATATDDAATKAAGTALLGRLRRGRGETPAPAETPAAPVPVPAPAADVEPVTETMPAVVAESDDGFPIAGYDQLRATDLLRQLGSLDRNQLEAVRDRETGGKNRFTILSRVDTLLEAQSEPAWEVADDDWEADAEAEAAANPGTTIIAVGPVEDDDDFAAGEMEDDEADEVEAAALDDDFDDEDEVDELVSPTDDFPIAGYDALTVGQILPRLSELDAGELAQVRAREQQGRARGTILDRVDRLASKSSAMAMPAPAARRAPARKAAPAPAAPVRKARAAKVAIPVPPATTTTPMKKAAAGRKAAAAPLPAPRKAASRKAAVAPEPAATTPMKEAVKKAAAGRRPAKAAAPEAATTPMKAAVKKARATKRP
jgi:hypothetical protein